VFGVSFVGMVKVKAFNPLQPRLQSFASQLRSKDRTTFCKSEISLKIIFSFFANTSLYAVLYLKSTNICFVSLCIQLLFYEACIPLAYGKSRAYVEAQNFASPQPVSIRLGNVAVQP
jgi:hypothetical protein